MIDEQIEKALGCCLTEYCPNDCPNLDIAKKTCDINQFHKDIFDYINRLKANLVSAIHSFTKMETLYKVKCKELECAEEKIRKQVAKDIFEELRANEEANPEDCDCWLVAVEGEKFIKIAKKYGVEVKI